MEIEKLTKQLNRNKLILCFDENRVLVAIFLNAGILSRLLRISRQSISFSCSNRCKSAKAPFFRHLHDKNQVAIEDIGIITVVEYDQICNMERDYFLTKKAKRKLKHKK